MEKQMETGPRGPKEISPLWDGSYHDREDMRRAHSASTRTPTCDKGWPKMLTGHEGEEPNASYLQKNWYRTSCGIPVSPQWETKPNGDMWQSGWLCSFHAAHPDRTEMTEEEIAEVWAGKPAGYERIGKGIAYTSYYESDKKWGVTAFYYNLSRIASSERVFESEPEALQWAVETIAAATK